MEYEVSSLGRVKSYKRGKEKILSTHTSKKGYVYVSLSVNKKFFNMTVHKLMAIAFLNVDTNHKVVVDHIDMNKENNTLENLRIVSQRENAAWERPHRDLPMGVYRTKSPGVFRVLAQLNGQVIYLGSYKTPEDAGEAYQSFVKSQTTL
jgi:hypothetical protein